MNAALKTAALAALFAVGSAVASTAATIMIPLSIGADDSQGGNSTIIPGDDLSFVFTATEDLVLTSISVSATGASGGADLNNIRFGLGSGTPTQSLTVFVSPTGAANGGGFVSGPPLSLSATDTFIVTVDEAINNANIRNVQFTVSANTELPMPPSPVPLPASGLLLLGVLGAGALLSRGRRG